MKKTCRIIDDLLYRPGSRADLTVYGAVLFMMALFFVWMELLMPLQLDDIRYVYLYRLWNNGRDDFSSGAFVDYFLFMRRVDNSRISNLLSPLSTIIEPWRTLYPYLTGIAMALTADMIRRFGQMKISLAVQGALIWTAMILFLPWRNNILVYDFALNYIYSTLITLLFILLLIVRLPDKRDNLTLILTSAAALLAGGWHEGFALPVLVALGVEYLVSGCRKPWRWYVPVSIYILSSALFALSPALLGRFSRELDYESRIPVYKMVLDDALVVLLIMSVAVFAAVPRLRERLKRVVKERRHLFLIFSVTSIFGAIIGLVVDHTARTSFWPEICAMISIMLLYGRLLAKERIQKTLGVVAIFSFLGCLLFSVHVLKWQYRYKKESDILMESLSESRTGTVFHDIIMPEDLPITTLYMPPRSSWLSKMQLLSLDNYFGSEGHVVVPEALRHPKRGAVGVSPGGKIFKTGGALWTDYLDWAYYSNNMRCRVRIAGGNEVSARVVLHPFISMDGDTLTYIKVRDIPVEDMEKVEIDATWH